MESRQTEILDILQEECAEVIQIASKCKRFGLENNHERLTAEVGDLYCMLMILKNAGIVNWDDVEVASKNKEDKLKIWSKIYE